MKTRKIYYDDAYKKEFNGEVIEIKYLDKQIHLALNQTCFYPGGGGQPSDLGVLGGASVVDCYVENDIIFHILGENGVEFEIEQNINGNIDFLRRYAFMQNHTGEHILSGLAKSRFNAQNVGFHMSEKGFTMDLNISLSRENLCDLESLANEAVRGNLVVNRQISLAKEFDGLNFRSKRQFAEDENVRIINIPNYDICACTGLHVNNTSEVGIIKIVDSQKYKGGVRLTVFCGADALWDYSKKVDICKEVGGMLSANADTLISATSKLLEQNSNLKKETNNLQNELFVYKIKEIEQDSSLAYRLEEGLDGQNMMRFANLMTERANIAIVLTKNDNSYKYAVCARSEDDLRNFLNNFNAVLDGKGGISGRMAQGVIKASNDEIINFMGSLG